MHIQNIITWALLLFLIPLTLSAANNDTPKYRLVTKIIFDPRTFDMYPITYTVPCEKPSTTDSIPPSCSSTSLSQASTATPSSSSTSSSSSAPVSSTTTLQSSLIAPTKSIVSTPLKACDIASYISAYPHAYERGKSYIGIAKGIICDIYCYRTATDDRLVLSFYSHHLKSSHSIEYPSLKPHPSPLPFQYDHSAKLMTCNAFYPDGLKEPQNFYKGNWKIAVIEDLIGTHLEINKQSSGSNPPFSMPFYPATPTIYPLGSSSN